MKDGQVGKVLAIALRTHRKGPMREVERVAASRDGLEGDVDATTQRAVTFLAAGQWKLVQKELSADIPWHTRRANVLVESDSLASLIGRTIQVGAVRVCVNAETRPCDYMDELHVGLRAALAPDCRAGVYGSVLEEGAIHVGDAVTVVA